MEQRSPLSWSAFYCCNKRHDQRQPGEERFHLAHMPPSHNHRLRKVTAGSWRQEQTWRRTAYWLEQTWRRTAYWLEQTWRCTAYRLAYLAFYTTHIHLLRCGTLSISHWILPHQSLIKKMLPQTCLQHSLMEGLSQLMSPPLK